MHEIAPFPSFSWHGEVVRSSHDVETRSHVWDFSPAFGRAFLLLINVCSSTALQAVPQPPDGQSDHKPEERHVQDQTEHQHARADSQSTCRTLCLRRHVSPAGQKRHGVVASSFVEAATARRLHVHAGRIAVINPASMKEISLLEMIGRSLAKIAAGAGVAALVIWLVYVMLDIGHMQSGFTLPLSSY
jgi:hypothetical protein